MGNFFKNQFARHVPPVFLSENVRNALADPPPEDMSADFPLRMS